MGITSDKLALEIVDGLKEFSEEVAHDVKAATQDAAEVVQSEIRTNAPKDTGAYARSWTITKVAERPHSVTFAIHSKNRYQLAHLLERGHAKRNGGRVPAQPHIANAEDKGIEFLEREIRRRIESG